MIAMSSSSPATRIDFENTMPLSEITAISVVPPPMSTIMLAAGFVDRETDADRGGHRLGNRDDVARASACMADSFTARSLDFGDAGGNGDHDARAARGTNWPRPLRIK